MKTQRHKRKHRKHRRPRWQRHAYTANMLFMRKIQRRYASERLQELDAQSEVVYKERKRHVAFGIGGIIYFVLGLFLISYLCRPMPESYRYHVAIILFVVLVVCLFIRDMKRSLQDDLFSQKLEELHLARMSIYDLF